MIRPALLSLFFLASLASALGGPSPVPPGAVLVLYNSAEPKSKKLAEHYAAARKIPGENVVGFDLPLGDSMSRANYESLLRDPLIKLFGERSWWERKEITPGVFQPVSNKIRFIACMNGVPYQIERTPDTIPEEHKKRRQYVPSLEGNEASVDSELSLLGVSGYPLKGPVNNPMFGKDDSVMAAASTAVLLVARLDGPGFPTCTRMIDDAVAIEREGLWGMCYLDQAKKGAAYEGPDEWMESILKVNTAYGIPTVIDRNADTFVTNYPMTDAALYFGWYSHHFDGPLLNAGFTFKRGAVAVHLHSFSADQLRNSTKRWCGPILAKGAAATLGNVYEPFLHTTHHFDIFHDRLLKGYTLAEAAYMAGPTVSWQGIVLGDPLYRPFPTLESPDLNTQTDLDYKLLRSAFNQWRKEPETLVAKVRSAAAKNNSGILYESLGLIFANQKQDQQAAAFFETAGAKYLRDSDKLRQLLHHADLERHSDRKQEAVVLLRQAAARFKDIPEAQAAVALVNILDPPAPPPVEVPPK